MPITYQNRSPFLRFENCLAIKHANVGPITAPGNFFSDTPADHRSMSSTCLRLFKFFKILILFD